MFKSLMQPSYLKRIIFFIGMDIILSIFTIYLSFLLRFNFSIPEVFYDSMYKMILLLIPIKLIYIILFNLHNVVWRYFSLVEYKKLFISLLLSYITFTVIYLFMKTYFQYFPRSTILIDFFLSIIFLGGIRVAKRLLQESSKKSGKKAIIIGATHQGVSIIKSVLANELNYEIVAILDNDSKGKYILNTKVFAENKLQNVINKYGIETVIIAKELSKNELSTIVELLNSFNIYDIKMVQYFKDSSKTTIKDISIEDLLARKPKDLDMARIKEFINNKKILITGAGGSIGSEIARQCMKYEAKELILLDHSEYNLYKIEQELEKKDKVYSILQSVANRELLKKTFCTYKPEIVIHAAAYKHVPLVEENMQEAIENNITGTKNIIDLSIENSVEKVVIISTDKAVRPTNVMGATKRVGELYAQNVKSNEAKIVAVRFGNVLGSSGSVIPKFKKQINEGGPITVTHPEITRYFMLIPEACSLVLQAAAIGEDRELFILDMGEPIKIADLANKMIELSGKKDIKIEYTGLRPGEKLYEELLINDSDKKTEYESIMVAKHTEYDIDKLNKDIEKLLNSQDFIDNLKLIVTEFNHSKNINEKDENGKTN